MPSIFSNRAARGEGCGGANVDLGERYSRKGDDKFSGRIVWLGRNLSAFDHLADDVGGVIWVLTSAFGVFSVWMNIVRILPAIALS